MLGEHTLFRFEWRTLSKMEEVECPRVEMCNCWGSKPRVENNEWHWQGKGFTDHFLHQDMWLQKSFEILGWPLKVTFVWDWRRRSMSFEMGSVFMNEKRMVLILFRERTSFNLMVKGITLVGRTWNRLKHKSESFCFAIDWSKGEDICHHWK